RSTDLVARYGGEEFVVLLPGTALEVAERVIERVRTTVESMELELDGGSPVRVTLSAGVAVHKDQGRSFANAETLVRMADRALYLAKRSGRNRVEIAD
ncbi:MAG TPA: GGDEF domain-containing protein, partial [Gammaproteobacteria bacterium]|nr:GGDEF domain-containing protein [Gammaproteobacteria bacterium]